MEQIENMLKLSQKNNLLKQLTETISNEFHKLIVDYFPQFASNNSQNNNDLDPQMEKNIHQLINNQILFIFSLENLCHQSLLKHSFQLIQFQLKQEHSNQMAILLKKYQDQIFSLRSQQIQKQNTLYNTNKIIYECYEDTYLNCAPTQDKLAGIIKNTAKKNQLISNSKELLKQLNQLEVIRNSKNKTNSQKQQIMQENQQQSQKQQKEEKNICNKNETSQKNDKIIEKYSPTPSSSKPQKTKPQQPIIQRLKKLTKQLLYQNQFQQSTSVSFKNTIKQNQLIQLNHTINIKQNNNTIYMPNFIQMSQFDYQLFSIYFHKINRQNQIYNNLIQQYSNYKDVFQIINQQNKQLIVKYQQKFHKNNHQSKYQDNSISKIQQNQHPLTQQKQQDIVQNPSILEQIQLQQQQLQISIQNNKQLYKYNSQKISPNPHKQILNSCISQPQLDHQIFFNNFQHIAKFSHRMEQIDLKYSNHNNLELF